MITIRGTQKFLKKIKKPPQANLEPSSNALGDWYANLIDSDAGQLIIFVNEKSFLTVGVPVLEIKNLFSLFIQRVLNLLWLIGVPRLVIELEHVEMMKMQIGKTKDRSVIGAMNELAFSYQIYAEDQVGQGKLSLQDAEQEFSKTPLSPLGYQYPRDVAKRLLLETWGIGTAREKKS